MNYSVEKVICTSLIFILMSVSTMAHELLMAKFDIVSIDEEYSLEIRLDLYNIVLTIEQECSMTGVSLDERIQAYVYDHFFLDIDGSTVDYELTSISRNDIYVFLKGKLINAPRAFNQMEVYNSCMIDTIEDHENLFQIKANNYKRRSFRMHKDRQKTIIKY